MVPFSVGSQFSGTPIQWGNFTHRYEFLIDLNVAVTDHVSFLGTVPSSQQQFASGQPLYDPEQLANTCGMHDPFSCLMQRQPLNAQVWQNQGRPYFADNLHGRYPTSGGQFVTVSVANLSTWVATPPQSPLKTVYSCWSPRDVNREKMVSRWSVFLKMMSF